MTNVNLGYQFYKCYYAGYPWYGSDNKKDQNDWFEKKNRVLLDRIFSPGDLVSNDSDNDTEAIRGFTAYPGLVSGTGYPHQTGHEGEFKIGFHFDYTSGMPVIPGSSVKGLLRNSFPKFGKDKNTPYEKQLNKARYIAWCIDGSPEDKKEEYLHLKKEDSKIKVVEELEQQIFEGKNNGVRMSLYECDVFFDSVIIEGNKDGYILADDFITPHKHTGNPRKPDLDPFSDPTPIKFLKVLPGVKWEFRFKLHNSTVSGKMITASEKNKLFEKILHLLGAGAKTNVGYGQFDSAGASLPTLPENKFPVKAIPFLLKNTYFDGTVTAIAGEYYMVSFNVHGAECITRKKFSDKLTLSINETVIVYCSNDYKPDSPNISIRKKT